MIELQSDLFFTDQDVEFNLALSNVCIFKRNDLYEVAVGNNIDMQVLYETQHCMLQSQAVIAEIYVIVQQTRNYIQSTCCASCKIEKMAIARKKIMKRVEDYYEKNGKSGV